MDHPKQGTPKAAIISATDPTAERRDADTLRALSELFGGLDVVDRALELDSGVRIDLVALGPGGELFLVLPVSGRGGSCLAAVLDLIAFSQSHATVLTNAYGADVGAVEYLRLVVVAEHYDDDVLRRLTCLKPCGVEIVRLGALRSSRGERVFAALVDSSDTIEPVFEERTVEVTPAVSDLDQQLRSMPAETASHVRDIARALQRIDDSLQATPARDGFVWSQDGDVLARLEVRDDGELVGTVPGRGSRPIAGRQGVETFVDETVAAFVDRTISSDEFDDI
ncbi:MAG: hypothetical protein ACYSWX_02735 [Planctomycetota bacterium]